MSSSSSTGTSVSVEATERVEGSAQLLSAFQAPRIQGLDFMRAVAVSLVMLGHATEGRSDMILSFGSLSALGVTVFFVLSGFLITRLLQDEIDRHGRIDLLKFYRRRVARLMPVFYLYVTISMTILWVRGKPLPWDAVGAALLYVVNYYQAFTGAQTNIVAHCWSLAVEEQFYMVWPLLLSGLCARRQNIASALVLIVLAVWAWRIYLVLHTQTSVDYLYRALDTRADALAVGCLIAVLMRSDRWRGRFAAVARLPLVGPVLVVVLYQLALADGQSAVFKYAFSYMVQPVVIGVLLLITLMVASRRGIVSGLINNRWVVHVGNVSYGMYLFHGMIMYSTHRVVAGYTGSFGLGLVLSFVAVIVFASLSFRWFETPMRKWINGR